MQEDNFQKLKVFQTSEINIICDLFTQEVLNITGEKPILVGSVAKMFNNTLPETYVPKDIDFTINIKSFRKILNIQHYKNNLFEFAEMVESRPERIIIYCKEIFIELWCFLQKNNSEKLEYKNNKIPYLCQ